MVTMRNRGWSVTQIIEKVNLVLRGWLNYFYLSRISRKIEELYKWVRRKLRFYRVKQYKGIVTVYKYLYQKGVPKRKIWRLAKFAKGYYRKALSYQAIMQRVWRGPKNEYSIVIKSACLDRLKKRKVWELAEICEGVEQRNRRKTILFSSYLILCWGF